MFGGNFYHEHRKQEKTSREDRKNREVDQLKAEVKKLKRQLSRIKKHDTRNQARIQEVEAINTELGLEEEALKVPESIGITCVKCQSTDSVIMTTPSGLKLCICKNCGNREKM